MPSVLLFDLFRFQVQFLLMSKECTSDSNWGKQM